MTGIVYLIIAISIGIFAYTRKSIWDIKSENKALKNGSLYYKDYNGKTVDSQTGHILINKRINNDYCLIDSVTGEVIENISQNEREKLRKQWDEKTRQSYNVAVQKDWLYYSDYTNCNKRGTGVVHRRISDDLAVDIANNYKYPKETRYGFKTITNLNKEMFNNPYEYKSEIDREREYQLYTVFWMKCKTKQDIADAIEYAKQYNLAYCNEMDAEEIYEKLSNDASSKMYKGEDYYEQHKKNRN